MLVDAVLKQVRWLSLDKKRPLIFTGKKAVGIL